MEFQHLLPLLDPKLLKDLLWASAPLLAAGGLMALGALNPALGTAAGIAYAYLSADKKKALEAGGMEFGGSGLASALTEGSNVTPWVKGFGKAAGSFFERVGLVGAAVETGERLMTVVQKYGAEAVERTVRSEGMSGAQTDLYPARSSAAYEVRAVLVSEQFPPGWFPSNVDGVFPLWRQLANDPLKLMKLFNAPLGK